MSAEIPVFRTWVPEWLIRLGLLLLVLPGIVLFSLSISNINAAAGYYGISPNDAQYSMIILYASTASFVVLEKRFFRSIACKEYLLIVVLILVATCYICYIVKSFYVLLIFRFLQGMLTSCTLSITLTLMFSRLHNERSKEIGYSVVYCVLLCVSPLSTLFTAQIIDDFNFNVIYKCAMFSFIPGGVLMTVMMNNIRLDRKLPLYQLDWPSFLLYSAALCLIGYVMVYGQQYEWLDDTRIEMSLIAIGLLLITFVVRQLYAKRPYFYIQAFGHRNFLLAVLLLFVFYISRGSFGITTSYMGSVLGIDPINMGYLLIYNIAAIVVSVTIASRLILQKTPTRLILIYGFSLLLVFHLYMCFMFGSQANSIDLIFPLILQGLGAGMLMVPIILFVVSSSPIQYGTTGSAVGIFVRFTGFCSSIALVNYFQLYQQKDHVNRFQDQLGGTSGLLSQRLNLYKQVLTGKGMATDQAIKASTALLNKGITQQAQLRSAVDYYQMISWMLLAVILVIALFPSISRTIIRLKNDQPAPIVY
ncbi:MFS transporter [Mucilaginibacter gynuensis]|uniref:MFS transporter n=1 Tax=Mucilaginibacter gynuensis TaxID=1302236 RepID=A0ABP8FVP1_9SPHI